MRSREPAREPAPRPEPGLVTAVRELPRRAGRYTVEIGGVPLSPVAVESIADFGLRIGRAVDAEALARLVAASAATACYDKAIDALARRARSTKDLERWLLQREQPRAAVESALERLTTLGLLDDVAFARAFARSRSAGKGFGPRRVAAELGRKGVARGTADQVIEELAVAAEEEDDEGLSRGERERAQVRAVALKRLRSLATLEPEVARRRLMGWLIRRGHAGAVAAQVARELIPR
jgi:regulatory protein